MDELQCALCCESILSEQASATLTPRGCEGIKKASDARGTEQRPVPGQQVHYECRRKHCNTNCIDTYNRKRACNSSEASQPSHSLRSLNTPFAYSKHCLFCGTGDIYGGRKNEYKLVPTRAADFMQTIQDMCTKRNDDWAHKVKSRINCVNDLHAADAVYHQACSVNFRTAKHIPQKYNVHNESTPKRVKLGRPKDLLQTEAFNKVISYLERNDDEQTTIIDLIHKMAEYLTGTDSEPYGFTYMKEQIQRQFGNKITITEVNGTQNVVTFWSTAATILQDFHMHQKQDTTEAEKVRIIQTAAKLIKHDMKSQIQHNDVYPSYEEITSIDKATAFLPDSLHLFMQCLFTSSDASLKMASIGQAMVQAARPRVILAPLQLGLGVQLHHHFASKFLIDTLHKHGFSCSYKEVTTFERSAAVNSETAIPNHTADTFVQYAADNVDHNICTLDGHNTFHGMGMIATITPGTANTMHIPRVKISTEDIAAAGRVNIKHFMPKLDGMRSVQYEELKKYTIDNPTANADLLWSISLPLRSPRPAWSGMMQLVHKGNHPGKSSILFLPMIDMNPSDMSCLYSTMLFVSSHARRYRVTPILTFDQPLWWKALAIQHSTPTDDEIGSIVLRLGGFHTEMSFLGTIGRLMEGTGLHELLECIYASNAVGHMLGGKAISRAVRGHMLVSGALNAILVSDAFGIAVAHTTTRLAGGKIQCEATSEDQDETEIHTEQELDQTTDVNQNAPPIPDVLVAAGKLYDDILKGSITAEELENSRILHDISQKLMACKTTMQKQLTAKLWLQYLEMVNILHTFIKAERTGNWQLHLQAMYNMLPYLAATGHNNYTKSIHQYLHNMESLEQQHPDVYQHFQAGLHVGRRSDRYWAGLSQDLLIEQVLMRSIKTTGGLTRGRGMTETQRLVWLLSANACSEVNLAMQELTSVSYTTSEQHKEMSDSRQKKDMTDTHKLLTFLMERNPFAENPKLHSIVTGVTADATVNAECARDVGNVILQNMIGKNVSEYSFQRKQQVVTLSNSSSVPFGNEVIHIDPQLLFQRLLTVGRRSQNLDEVFEYELCSFPPALFENKTMPRLANKASLNDSMWKMMPSDMPVPTGNVQYILDGGALLHRITWNRGSTYEQICEQYVKYVANHYGRPVVVFDGYLNGPSTKDPTQQRRSGNHVGATIQFSGSMVFNSRKEDFLSNKENKQRFISLLSDKLQRHGCHTEHAEADADVLIVRTAITASEKMDQPTVVVADDTDILILLCFHTKSNTQNIYLRPEPRYGMKKAPRCWNIGVTKTTLGSEVCENLLFVHAILGCDTTSHLYGLGKGAALKLIRTNQEFQKQAKVFRNPKSTDNNVVAAGENAMVALYKGQPGDTLNYLKLQRFHQKVASSTSSVKPEMLPPTSAAAKFHSKRVYLQVQQWMGHGDEMKPEDWGWYEKDGKYWPVLTDKEAAPMELLELVRCNCKMGCANRQCSCRKHGLDCSTGCSQCRGVCSNMTILDDDALSERDE